MKKLSVVLFALMLAAVLAGSAFAEATPYMSVRFTTTYTTQDHKMGADDVEDLVFGFVTGNGTRFGVKFKADALTGLFELNNAMGLRHLYGSYDFGAGALLIGQTWLPYTFLGSTTVHRPGLGTAGDGAMYSWGSFGIRKAQMRLALKMGLYAALIKNQTETDGDDVVDLPELAVGYIGTFGKTTVGVHGSYMEDDTDADSSTCYLLAADVKTQAGPVGLQARAFYGRNLTNMLGSNAEGLATASASDDMEDLGGYAQASFKISDALSVVGGVGYVKNEQTGAANYDERFVYFVNLPVKVAKGFVVTPEIAYYDNIENAAGSTEYSALWFGAKWQMDF